MPSPMSMRVDIFEDLEFATDGIPGVGTLVVAEVVTGLDLVRVAVFQLAVGQWVAEVIFGLLAVLV